MHIFPYHKRKTWQLFIVGTITGAIIAYLILAMMYGKMYEQVLTDKIALQGENRQLILQNETLMLDKEQLEEKASLTVQTMEVNILNSKQFRLDRLIVHQLSDLIEKELNYTIGKDVKSIAESSELLIALIENKVFLINDVSYEFEIKKLIITEQIHLHLNVKYAA